MKTTPLYMVRETGDDNSTPEFLTTADYFPHMREPRPEEITLEALTQLMDENAERCNAHNFVCVHRGLAAILFREVGRKAATKIMRRLVNYGGLHGLIGAYGQGDVGNAEEELEVSLHGWKEWRLE